MRTFFILVLLVVLVIVISGCASSTNPVDDKKDNQDTSQSDIEVLVLDGKYFSKDQFHISNNPDDNCKSPHYHADLVTSVCEETKADPAPEHCGFGKVSEVPLKKITQEEMEKLCPEKELELNIDCEGGGSTEGKDELSPEDLKKYDKVQKEVRPLTQPQSTTCGPASGAMDLVYWNKTITPGLVTIDPESLIKELAKRMETSGVHGTRTDKMALGLADYLEEFAKGNFSVKLTYKSTRSGKTITRNVRGASVAFERRDSITVDDLGSAMDKKANIIVVHVREDDNKAHARKIVALDTKGKNGQYKIAFADPEKGKIVEVEMDYDGNFIDGRGDRWRLTDMITVTPNS